MAEVAEQWKEDHEDYVGGLAAKELIGVAKNQFYNPKPHEPAPKRELSEEERLTANMGGTLALTAARVASRAPASPWRKGAAASFCNLWRVREEVRGEQRRHRDDELADQGPCEGDPSDGGCGEGRAGGL